MSELESANIIMTGGAGTLGNAIAERRKRDGWTGGMTVYSTDSHKHEDMRRKYPDIRFVQGDIRSPDTLYNAFVGHDVVLHLAAVKVIPDAEWWSIDTLRVNVDGSHNVCEVSIAAGVKHVLGISTDKACHPANAYGATKLLMEKVFQEYARVRSETNFHLVRYGNVVESNSSVIPIWKQAVKEGKAINITDPAMTRFWLSPSQAVDLVIDAMDVQNGAILIPKMKALSIGKLARYVLGEEYQCNIIPLRPGEKMHETLLTSDECPKAFETHDYFILPPTTSDYVPAILVVAPYTSETAPEFTEAEFMALLENA